MNHSVTLTDTWFRRHLDKIWGLELMLEWIKTLGTVNMEKNVFCIEKYLNLRGRRTKCSRCWQGWFLLCSLVCRWPLFHCTLTWPFYVYTNPLCVFLLLRGHQAYWIRAIFLWCSLISVTTLKALSPNIVMWDIRASTHKFEVGGHVVNNSTLILPGRPTHCCVLLGHCLEVILFRAVFLSLLFKIADPSTPLQPSHSYHASFSPQIPISDYYSFYLFTCLSSVSSHLKTSSMRTKMFMWIIPLWYPWIWKVLVAW